MQDGVEVVEADEAVSGVVARCEVGDGDDLVPVIENDVEIVEAHETVGVEVAGDEVVVEGDLYGVSGVGYIDESRVFGDAGDEFEFAGECALGGFEDDRFVPRKVILALLVRSSMYK